VLTQGRYVGTEEIEDDGAIFEERMKQFTATLRQQTAKVAKLDGRAVGVPEAQFGSRPHTAAKA
jgi:hypothetical protein